LRGSGWSTIPIRGASRIITGMTAMLITSAVNSANRKLKKLSHESCLGIRQMHGGHYTYIGNI
jgi:hypothetical protein